MITIPRFKNGYLIPNEELDVYPQTQENILASMLPEDRERERANTDQLKESQQTQPDDQNS